MKKNNIFKRVKRPNETADCKIYGRYKHVNSVHVKKIGTIVILQQASMQQQANDLKVLKSN